VEDPVQATLDTIRLRTQELASGGAPAPELIVYLHGAGLTIVESIRILRQTLGLGTGEAKRLVAEHPVWRDEVQASQPLHDAVEARLDAIAARRRG
jgi:ribosomal protein L7/L12